MSKQLFDQYTLLHFASGIVVYFWGINFTHWIILHTLFEMFENTKLGMNIINKYIGIWPGGKPHIDSNVKNFKLKIINIIYITRIIYFIYNF